MVEKDLFDRNPSMVAVPTAELKRMQSQLSLLQGALRRVQETIHPDACIECEEADNIIGATWRSLANDE